MLKKCAISFLFALCLLCGGCSSFRPSWVDENSWEVTQGDDITPEDFDGPLGGRFNEKGEWVPDDPTIELTYKIPDISAGFLFDANSLDVTPSLQIEIVEFDLPGGPFRDTFLRWVRTWKFDFGVAYQRAYFYLGPRLTSIFEISVGAFCGWNWEDEELSYGVGFTVIKF